MVISKLLTNLKPAFSQLKDSDKEVFDPIKALFRLALRYSHTQAFGHLKNSHEECFDQLKACFQPALR